MAKMSVITGCGTKNSLYACISPPNRIFYEREEVRRHKCLFAIKLYELVRIIGAAIRIQNVDSLRKRVLYLILERT